MELGLLVFKSLEFTAAGQSSTISSNPNAQRTAVVMPGCTITQIALLN
jgi:hypothetical protein